MRNVLVLFLLSTVAQVTGAQTVTGSVRDLGTGDPVFGAMVSLLGSDATAALSVQTDSLGSYRLSAATGTYRVRVSRIGYAPSESGEFSLTSDSVTNRDIFLKAVPAELASVDVSAKPVVTATLANPHKFDLFLERRSRGFGFFLTHDEIKAKNIHKLQQLLQSVPGIKVRQIRSTWVLQSQHCSGKSIPGMGGDETIRPVVFVDGHFTKGQEQLDLIDASEVEGIEVYQGGGELPAEAIGQACFAVFIWLRTIEQ